MKQAKVLNQEEVEAAVKNSKDAPGIAERNRIVVLLSLFLGGLRALRNSFQSEGRGCVLVAKR